MPAVILVELLAQTGGLAAAAPAPANPAERLQLRVAAIGPIKFPAAALPGVVLEARARVAGRIGGLYKIEGTVTADGVLVAAGSLTLAGDRRHAQLPPRLRGMFGRLRTEGAGAARETAAVSLGVFIGCLPLYGLHLLICWTLGWPLSG